MSEDRPEFLTVRELAAFLRVKERKVYSLAASGEIPCSRATGKLIFPRAAVEAWVSRHSSGKSPATRPVERPLVFVGSHDPLLDWALRESRSGLASFFDGSLDGIARLRTAKAVAAGVHLYESERNDWNVRHVEDELLGEAVVLIEWAWRERGFIVAGWNGDPGVEKRIKEETKATIRVMPMGDPIEAKCIVPGEKGREVWFAQAY